MSAIPAYKSFETKTTKVIELSKVIEAMGKQKKVRLNKDGTVNKVKCHKVAGVSSEVYPFDEEEIELMLNKFNEKIDNAPNDDKLWIAKRNKLLFVLGINLGVRASDLADLTYSSLLREDGSFKEFYKLQPKKTKKTGKFVPLYFNEAVKKAIANYLEDYPVENLNEFIFKSRVGDGHITEKSLGRIIKDTAAECNIQKNVCSHSLRKTFGSQIYRKSEDKNNTLILLQIIFSHSSPAITSRYIGITSDEISEVYNGLNLGMDFID